MPFALVKGTQLAVFKFKFKFILFSSHMKQLRNTKNEYTLMKVNDMEMWMTPKNAKRVTDGTRHVT